MQPDPLADDLDEILARCESRFRRMAGERIFVTGGTGFFGRWLLEALCAADARLGLDLRITVLSRDPEAFGRTAPHLFAAPAINWWRGDVRDFQPPPGTFPLIIHAATAASKELNVTQPRVMFDTIVDGTRRLLDFAAEASTRALLLTSSGAVYGRQPPEISLVDEEFTGAPVPNSPNSAYAEGKRAAEFLAAASGLPAKIARGFAFVGPYLPLDAHFAAGNFIGDAVAGRPIAIQGDGTPVRSYLYAADLVVWLLAILLDGAPNRPYNVGSDNPISIIELAATIADAAGGLETRALLPPGTLPPERYVPDIGRARGELGLDVWTPLPEALGRTLRWARMGNRIA